MLQVADKVDDTAAAFHQRRFLKRQRVLLLHGVVRSRKTGTGAVKRPVRVPMGIRKDGWREILDSGLVPCESEILWESFFADLALVEPLGVHFLIDTPSWHESS